MIIQARHALVSAGVLLRDVQIEIHGNRITAIGPVSTAGAGMQRPDYVFKRGVVTPGFVNAHAHLELEFCSGAVPYTGSFIDWLQAIRDLKRDRGGQSTAYPAQSLNTLLAAGCTTVVDHHTFDLDWEAVESHGPRYVPMREVFGFNNHDPDVAWLLAHCRRSLAPHAPYTASLELAQACGELARDLAQPLSMHLSEIPGEISFIRDGHDDEIQALLALAGAAEAGFHGTGCSPIRLYAEAGLLAGNYAVHVNYLAPGDLELLVACHPTVVYCPRSHAFFGHPPHPLPQYLAAGVPVALGTDSLASNDLLSPLAEAKLAHQRFPQVELAQLFAAITVRGLAPLGWDLLLGELAPGRLADLAVFNLAADPAADFATVFAAVLDHGQAELTMVNGVVRWESEQARTAAG